MKTVKKATMKSCNAGQLRDGASNEVAGDVRKKNVGKEKKKKQRKKKKTKVVDYPVKIVALAKEEKVETTEDLKIAAANHVEISDNIVLRKLLRGPRYFDPQDSDWRSCYNCGEGGHTSANCSSVKRKKPCFRCGSLEHNAKQCKKRRDCFFCKKGDHRAKSCPEKHKWGSQTSKKCLKCGDVSHDMFSCKNNYSPDDLEEIQCYICNRFGHLCCAAFGDVNPREPSCYRCGRLGHTGLECQRSRGEPTSVGPLRASIKCGEGEHFLLQCTSSTKVHKTNVDLATPMLNLLPKENMETEEVRAMPSDSSKSHKRKRDQYEGGRFSTPFNSRRSSGSMNEYSGDLQQRDQYEGGRFSTPFNSRLSSGSMNEYSGDLQHGYGQVPLWRSQLIPTYNVHMPRWGSPVTPTYNAQVPGWGSPLTPTYNAQVPGWGSPVIPTYNGNLINTPIANGHASSSQLLRRPQELHFGPLASNILPIFHQNIHPGSAYGNFNGYGMRSNYYR